MEMHRTWNDVHSSTRCDAAIHQPCSRKPSKAFTVSFCPPFSVHVPNGLADWLLIRIALWRRRGAQLIVLQLTFMAHQIGYDTSLTLTPFGDMEEHHMTGLRVSSTDLREKESQLAVLHFHAFHIPAHWTGHYAQWFLTDMEEHFHCNILPRRNLSYPLLLLPPGLWSSLCEHFILFSPYLYILQIQFNTN